MKRASTRRWRITFVVVAGAVVLAAAARWLLVPNWRPPLRPNERYGIDVSGHQGGIDWSRVADDGIDFAYIKATEGADFVDRRFAENWSGAHRAGLDRGAYHFFTLCTSGERQARNFLAVAPPDPSALPPAVDLELAGNCRQPPDAATVLGELDAFIRSTEAEWGRQLVLYVGNDFERRYAIRDRLGRPLWHRRFLRRPDVERWVIWQLHGYARVSGVAGGVDLDVGRAIPSP